MKKYEYFFLIVLQITFKHLENVKKINFAIINYFIAVKMQSNNN